LVKELETTQAFRESEKTNELVENVESEQIDLESQKNPLELELKHAKVVAAAAVVEKIV
jgi:hypothetical protein